VILDTRGYQRLEQPIYACPVAQSEDAIDGGVYLVWREPSGGASTELVDDLAGGDGILWCTACVPHARLELLTASRAHFDANVPVAARQSVGCLGRARLERAHVDTPYQVLNDAVTNLLVAKTGQPNHAVGDSDEARLDQVEEPVQRPMGTVTAGVAFDAETRRF
jgi:hypothetical protein